MKKYPNLSKEQKMNVLKNKKPGTYAFVYSKKENQIGNDLFIKYSAFNVRLGIHYENVKDPNAKSTPNPNVSYIIPQVLKYNAKTHNYLVNMYITHNDQSVIETYYEKNGVEITKDEYEKAVPPKPSHQQPTLMFCKKLEDIIYIK